MSQLGTLKIMDRLINSPSFYSGTGGELVKQANKALAAVGVVAPEKASPAELFSALSNQLVLDATGGSLGAQISNADRDFIMNTAPNLATTPAGNKELIATRRKLLERQRDIAAMGREYAKRNGGRLDSTFDDYVAEWAEANPLFPQTAQPAAPAAPSGAAPAGGNVIRYDAQGKRIP